MFCSVQTRCMLKYWMTIRRRPECTRERLETAHRHAGRDTHASTTRCANGATDAQGARAPVGEASAALAEGVVETERRKKEVGVHKYRSAVADWQSATADRASSGRHPKRPRLAYSCGTPAGRGVEHGGVRRGARRGRRGGGGAVRRRVWARANGLGAAACLMLRRKGGRGVESEAGSEG